MEVRQKEKQDLQERGGSGSGGNDVPDTGVEINLRDLHEALKLLTKRKISTKQIEFVFKVVEMSEQKQMDFPLFCTTCSLAERIVQVDEQSKSHLEHMMFPDTCVNMHHCKGLFNMLRDMTRSEVPTEASHKQSDVIPADVIKAELLSAGNKEVLLQLHDLLDEITNKQGYITYVQFVACMPLFLRIHRSIVDRPLP